ncbi:PTS sugar transporter subunit IIC [candidate division WOR-3 bacterium]|jgi:mannose/fructose/N-acetylgalactosamine-specific phosphotransferase system component IIC|nr:PTS sugar transporter subunit IIC [candidate division WOR-3 bacterium]
MSVILISIIGSAILLDKYAFGEFGISQPIISGTIIGALFGDIQTGIFLGAIFQLIFLGGLPIGRNIPPDGQAAGVIGCGSYFLLGTANSSEHSLFLATIFALLGAIIGGVLDIYTRQYNEKLNHMFMRKEHYLYLCHLSGLVTAFMRTLCVFLPFFILSSIITIPAGFPQMNREILMIIGISIGLANAIYLFIRKTTIIYMVLGGLCGLALLVL